jgi:putative membrane-bound dehydrogenase-like protein
MQIRKTSLVTGALAGWGLTLWLGHVLAQSAAAQQSTALAPGWQIVAVPGPFRSSETAWLRAWVRVPDAYFAAHERNLFEESVGIYIRDLAGAHELWVNGVRAGQGGEFAPNYRSGGETLHRHKVPIGTLRKGGWNELALRVYQPPDTGPGGFLGEAPFIMDYFLEGILRGPWEYLGHRAYSPGTALSNKPPTAAVFDSFRESSRVLGRTVQVPGPHLTPSASAAKLRPAAGLVAELLLSEPLIAQPTHFSFDARGRLWVAQYRQYPYPAGLRMLSRDKYYRAHYDKVPQPPPNHDRGADIISIHEDTDGDGAYDRHKVFLEGLNLANAVLHGHGGVWVMHTPYLLFYADANGDDVPDGPPEVRLAGFGFEDTHAVANGLTWGPDGWLYGAQGSTTSCRVTRPDVDPSQTQSVYFEGCMVWRYHPRTRAFEIFAEGGGNTFGLEWDAQGRLFSGHNGGGTRGWHFVQGGFYEMQGVDPGKFGPPRNPYAFGDLPMMRTTNHAVRFTHFGAFAEGTALPPTAAGRLFALDPLHNTILTSERLPRGATFETVDREPALRSDDETFRPLYIANAPDGSLFISDMCEFYIAHGQHYQNQIDPTTGRIYRLRAENATLEKDTHLEGNRPRELLDLLAHPNKWHRQTALRLIGENRDSGPSARLRRWLGGGADRDALHALWALHQSSGLDATAARTGLRHPYPPVRSWTARLLGDDWGVHRNLGLGSHSHSRALRRGTLPPATYRVLLDQAHSEADPEVLAQFASTARRLDPSQAFPLVGAVLRHDDMARDPYVPLLCWWALEAHLPAAHTNVVELLRSQELWDQPLMRDHIVSRLARRYTVEGKRADLLRCADLFRLAPRSEHAAQLLRGVEDALRGRPSVALPEALVAAIAAKVEAPLIIRLKLNDPAAATAAVSLSTNRTSRLEDRLLIIRALGEGAYSNAVPALLDVAAGVEPAALRRAALASLATYDDAGIGPRIAGLLPTLADDVLSAASTLLASRARWSAHLLAAVEGGSLERLRVPEDAVNRLRNNRDPEVAQRAARLWPRSETPPSQRHQQIEQVGAILRRAPGNPYAGEPLFQARCAGCHKLFFKGGGAGPDLTSYQRDNLATLLPSVVDPNAEIRDGYQYVNLETKDGRDLTGLVVDRDNQVVVLREPGGEQHAVRTGEIAGLQPLGRSLMPEGLLDGLSDQELRDLFAYLRISQPITH